MEPRLTIVLPLKGRPLFTLRFLWHANRESLPFRFLIADGQVHCALAEILENSTTVFPNLDIEYVRYPDDIHLGRFYAKMADALQRVHTPYAVLADNDDFLIGSGIEHSIEFLDANLDYVCAAGRIAGFSVYSGINNRWRGLRGTLNSLYEYYTTDDVASPLVVERLRKAGLELWIYYAIFRTEALATIMREIAEANFSDLLFYEVFVTMRALTFGKAHSDQSTVSYLRQYGTSMTAAVNNDWLHRLIRGRFTADVHAIVDRIVSRVTAGHEARQAETAEEVLALLEAKFRQLVRAQYGSLQEVKSIIRKKTPLLVQWLKNRRRYFAALERNTMIRRLASSGASPSNVARFRSELASVREVLEGTTFVEFLRRHGAVADAQEML